MGLTQVNYPKLHRHVGRTWIEGRMKKLSKGQRKGQNSTDEQVQRTWEAMKSNWIGRQIKVIEGDKSIDKVLLSGTKQKSSHASLEI